VRVVLCRPSDLGTSDLARWRGFQQTTRELASPFLTPEFALAADRTRPWVRVAVIHDDGEIVGYLPYSKRTLSLGSGVAPGLSGVIGVIQGRDEHINLAELASHVHLNGWSFNTLLATQAEAGFWRSVDSLAVRIDSDFESYLEGLRVNSGTRLRAWALKRLRRMEREHEQVKFVNSPSAELLSAFHRLKNRQVRERGWFGQLDKPWVRAMMEDLATERSDALSGLLTGLVVDGRIAAVNFYLRSRTDVAHWHTAYDPDFGLYSPGGLLFFHDLERFAVEGVRFVDMGAGANALKKHFSNDKIQLLEGFVGRTGNVGRLLNSLAPQGRALRERAPKVERQLRALLHKLDGTSHMSRKNATESASDED